MASFTVHDVDRGLDERLALEARRRKTSKNRLVKDLLSRSLGLSTEGAYADDYREFVGLWCAEESRAFRLALADNERVDAGDWSS